MVYTKYRGVHTEKGGVYIVVQKRFGGAYSYKYFYEELIPNCVDMKKYLLPTIFILISFYLQSQDCQQNNIIEDTISRDANDDPSGANTLTLGQSWQAYINPSGDVDWIKVYISEAGTIHVNCDVPSTNNYDIEHYNSSAPSGWQGGSYNGTGQDETINKYVNNSGWYYINHYGYNGSYSSANKYYTTVTFTSGNLDVDPDVEYIRINGTPVNSGATFDVYLDDLSETFELKIQGGNDGDDECPDNMSYLGTSFEQFTSSSDQTRINFGSKSSDISLTKVYGSTGGGDGYANYVMVEGSDNDGWTSNETNYYNLTINPKQWGNCRRIEVF